MTTGGDAPDGYQIVDRTVCHDGFIRVERHRLRFRLFAGGWSDVVEREVVKRGHAAAVLLYDPDLDRVVPVEQFRAAAPGAPGGPWLMEAVAAVGDGRIIAANAVIPLQWLALNRERLRAAWRASG